MKISTETYLILIPEHNYAGKTTGIKADRIVARLPKLNSRSIAVKLNVAIDNAVFAQFIPEINIDIDDPREVLVPTVTVEQVPVDVEELPE